MNIEIPAGMNDAALLALVIGFVAPLVLNLINKATWPNWAKSLVAFGFAAIVGTATAYFAGAFTGLGVVSTVLLILVVSITAYQNFWKQVAPNLQRGSAEANAIKAQEKVDEIVSIAKPVAAAKAEEVVNAMPVATIEVADSAQFVTREEWLRSQGLN